METEKVEIEIPKFEGFKFIGWQQPKKGQYALSAVTSQLLAMFYNSNCFGIVYEKIPQKKLVDLTSDLTKDYKWGEPIEARVALKERDNIISFVKIVSISNKGFLDIYGCFWDKAQIEVEVEN